MLALHELKLPRRARSAVHTRDVSQAIIPAASTLTPWRRCRLSNLEPTLWARLIPAWHIAVVRWKALGSRTEKTIVSTPVSNARCDEEHSVTDAEKVQCVLSAAERHYKGRQN